MDEVDRKILEQLEEDARRSFTDIARESEVSEGTVRNRVEKMKENDVIKGFSVERGESGVKVFVTVTVSTDQSFEQVISEMPEDVKAYELAGDIDIIVELSRENSEEVNEIVDAIRAIEGVNDTHTYMVLSEE